MAAPLFVQVCIGGPAQDLQWRPAIVVKDNGARGLDVTVFLSPSDKEYLRDHVEAVAGPLLQLSGVGGGTTRRAWRAV